jgi:hypothetical protein
MKSNGINLARFNSHSDFDGDAGLLVHDGVPTVTDVSEKLAASIFGI